MVPTMTAPNSTATKPTESRHRVRDVSVRLKRGGSGPPVLFLHGGNGWPQWGPFFQQLAERSDLHVPEHPGYGTSDNPPYLRNTADLAMYYLDFLDALGEPKVHLVGHSLGGWTAAELAVRSCVRLASLTLIAPAGLRITGLLSGDMFMWGPEEAVRNVYHDQAIAERILAQPITDEDADLALTNRFASAKFGWEPRWYSPSLERWLHRISVPTLVLWGAEDKLFPAAYAARWGERIPQAKVEIIPQCGHVPIVEKADVTARKVLDLIGRT
jgi:pimeloyl-ACP methyl ester carboxylesterase